MRGTGCRRFPDARRLPSTRNGRQPAELRDQRAARAGDDPDPPLGPSISNHTVVPGPMVRGATPHRLASSSTIPKASTALRLSVSPFLRSRSATSAVGDLNAQPTRTGPHSDRHRSLPMNHRIGHQFTREQLCIVNLQPRPLGQQCVQPVSNSTHRGGLTGQPPDLHTARPVMGATSHHPAKANEVMAKRSRPEPPRCPPLPESRTSRRRQGCAERAAGARIPGSHPRPADHLCRRGGDRRRPLPSTGNLRTTETPQSSA